MLHVVGYIRVSTEDQHLGIDAQKHMLIQLALRQGLPEPVFFLDHGVSGAIPHYERPGFTAMLASGPTHVLAAKRDRLARDVMQALFLEKELLRLSITLLTTDAPSDQEPGSKLMRTIIDAFAEYERAMISHRTKLALAQAKLRGKKIGGHHHPYGSKPGEQDIISYIAKHLPTSKPRHIATQLTALGYLTRQGKPFHSEDVKGIWKRQCK